MHFDGFIAVDWSGAKGPNLPGLQVALAEPGISVPFLVEPPDGRWWRRNSFFDWLVEIVSKHRFLIGFDFSFGYPFADCGSYFPGASQQPKTAMELWETIEKSIAEVPDFYGAPFYQRRDREFHRFYLTPEGKGDLYRFRRRITDVACSTITSPHPVLKCVGAANVGTGSLAGMRLLKRLSDQMDEFVSIWPFALEDQKSILVEIFPRLYFKKANLDPRFWQEVDVLNRLLNYYGSQLLETSWRPSREDEADAIVSAAALRAMHSKKEVWQAPVFSNIARIREGWIFGVE